MKWTRIWKTQGSSNFYANVKQYSHFGKCVWNIYVSLIHANGERNGNPLQFSCLENSIDRGVRHNWATFTSLIQVRRDKKAFLSKQRKEENNRKGKTRDLFKKNGDNKGIFHARMGTVKDRNDKDLTEAEAINKKWQGYTELYKRS